MKVLLYIFTAAGALYFGFWEMKIKRDLTSSYPERATAISDMGILDDLAKRMDRERFITALPKAMKRRLEMVITLKFFAVGILIVEVILLQR